MGKTGKIQTNLPGDSVRFNVQPNALLSEQFGVIRSVYLVGKSQSIVPRYSIQLIGHEKSEHENQLVDVDGSCFKLEQLPPYIEARVYRRTEIE